VEPIETRPLAEAPQAIATLARWFAEAWPDYYAGRRVEAIAGDFPALAAPALPWIVTAWRGDRLVGTAALRERSILSHAHLGPWLGGLLVEPRARRTGVASTLVDAVATETRRRGFDALYAGTVEAHGLFEALGWARIAETVQDGEAVTVFETRLR
jgi:GNAT superfamily N-acetyltransferase